MFPVLVVAYVLTATVSLAAGAASPASAFPEPSPYLLEVCLGGLAVITAVNLRGVAERARISMLPMVLFVAGMFGVIVLGLVRHQHGRHAGARARQKQRGLLLAAAPRARTDVVVCTNPYRLSV